MSTPIDTLSSMSPQARWALKQNGFESLEAAAAKSDQELLAIPGFKEASLARLRAWQADPDAPQLPAGRFQPAVREDRIFHGYFALRGLGMSVEKAQAAAIAEVDGLTQHLRRQA